MSISAEVTSHIVFSGDQELELIWNSAELADSPAIQEVVTLALGSNTIDVPDVDDFTVHGLAIIPPAENSVELRLKGVDSDTGFLLSANKVSIFQFGATPPSTLVILVAAPVVGVRLVWF